jgi:hypothetical protein
MTDGTAIVQNSVLYQIYFEWCSSHKLPQLARNVFMARIKKYGVKDYRGTDNIRSSRLPDTETAIETLSKLKGETDE